MKSVSQATTSQVATKLTLKLTVAALAGAGVLSSASVWAQDAQIAADKEAVSQAITTVVVTGVRRAAQSAQAIKKNSDEVVDSIVAEEAGKFPDKNVAEMLGRIPGIQIRRENGEATDVRIRGLAGAVTLLNGREVFTSSGRGIVLSDIPSAMLRRVDVYKTQGGEMIEGGSAGVIDVRTTRPFDEKGFSANVAARVENRDKAKTRDPLVSGMVTNRWKTSFGEIGALVGLSYQDGTYHDEVTWNSPPVKRNNSTLGGFTGPDAVGHVLGEGNRKRTAGNLAFQWRPNSTMEFFAEGMATKIDHKHQAQFFVADLAWWSNPTVNLIPGTTKAATITASNLPAAPFTLSSTQAPWTVSEMSTGSVGGRWIPTDSWQFTTELSRNNSKVRQDLPIVDFLAFPRAVTANTFVNGGAQMYFPGYDMSNPANYNIVTLFDNHNHSEGNSTDWRADATWSPEEPGLVKEVMFGVRLANRSAAYAREKDGFIPAPGALPLSGTPGLACQSIPMAGDYGLPAWVTPCADYMHANMAGVRKLFGRNSRTAEDELSRFNNQESTKAVYVKAKYGTEIGGIALDGTFGVRVVKTDSELNGFGRANNVITPVSTDVSSTDVLPNFSLKAQLAKDWIGRFNAGKSMQRPAFADYNPGVSYNVPSTTVFATGTGGNPNLKPIEGNNFDVSAEWYFAPTGSLTATLYRHDFKDWIVISSTKETYNNIVYDVNRPRNLQEGRLEGLEIGYQQFYDWLPGWLSGFGIQANATYSKGYLIEDDGAENPFGGMSKLSYNLVGLYERGPWSGRMAYSWRDKFVDTFNYRGIINAQGKGMQIIVDPIKTLDGSISYKVNRNLALTLDVENMLDRKYHDYHDVPNDPRDIRRYDRVIGLALRWKM